MKRIPIPLAHYHVYVVAARRLGQKLGRRAPSPIALIRHELGHRRSKLIADEYLESIGGRKRTVRPREDSRGRGASSVGRFLDRGVSLAADPSRN